jgi:hypothetical protein
MFNFDEKSQSFEPPVEKKPKSLGPKRAHAAVAPGAGKAMQNFTIGVCTGADGSMKAPLCILQNFMQPGGGVVQEVCFKNACGEEVTMKCLWLTLIRTSTTKWLKACFFADLPKHDCCDDSLCKTVLFLDDRASLHWTTHVQDIFKDHGPHVERLEVPETGILQPNVITCLINSTHDFCFRTVQ